MTSPFYEHPGVTGSVSRGTFFTVLTAAVSSTAKTRDLCTFPRMLRAPHEQEDPWLELCLPVPFCLPRDCSQLWVTGSRERCCPNLALPPNTTLLAMTPKQAMKPREKHKFTPKQDPSCPFLSCFRFLTRTEKDPAAVRISQELLSDCCPQGTTSPCRPSRDEECISLCIQGCHSGFPG